jgi:phosphoribosylanthranilate isomerase
MPLTIKICGLRTSETLDAAVQAGADWVAFNFFAKSPRSVSLDEARMLSRHLAHRAKAVALLVDPDDASLEAVIDAAHPDFIQLHGKETPDRVAAIKARFGLPLIKAVGVSEAADIEAARAYSAADWILLDAKPPKGADLPGGNGVRFDWNLLFGLDLGKPFMVSGGLDPSNVGTAIRLSHPAGVDVASGVESAPGVKDRSKIAAFVTAARQAAAEA